MNGTWRATADGMWLPHPEVPQIGGGRRILHIATRFLRGGAERNIAHSVAWERAAGFEVELAFGPDADTTAIPSDIPTHRIASLARSVGPRDVVAVRELRRLIRAGRYDIVHTHLSKAGVVGRLAARGLPNRVIHTVHMSSFGPGYNRVASAIYQFAERLCASMTDAMVFVGAELRDDYVRAGVLTPESTMIIRSPIDLEPFLETRAWSENQRRDARAQLGAPLAGSLVLTVGTLEPRKRHDLIIHSLADWLRNSSTSLVIAGAGPARQQLEATVDELGLKAHVFLAGHVSNISASIAAADVVVHASAAEGVPQVVIQALAAGRPIAATKVTGLREVPEAPVFVVGGDGTELLDGVNSALSSRRPPVAESSLADWQCPAVDRQLGEFFRSLAP